MAPVDPKCWVQGLIDGTQDFIAAHDKQHRFIAFNRAYQREFHKVYGVVIRLGDRLSSVLEDYPQDLIDANQALERALNGEEFTVTREFGDPARERNIYELRCSPIRDEAGQVIGATHIVRDVSDHHRTEAVLKAAKEELEHRVLERTQELKEAQRKSACQANELQAIFDSIHAGVLVHDRKGKPIRANTTAVQVFGFDPSSLSREEFGGFAKRIKTRFLDGRPCRQEDLPCQLALREGKSASARLVMVNAQGNQCVVEVRSTLLTHDGVSDGVVSVWYDVSEQEHLQAQLEENQKRVREQLAEIEAIYHSAPVGLCVLDRNLCYVRINAQMAEMNGLPISAHLKRRVAEVVPDIGDQIEVIARDVLTTGNPVLNLEIAGEMPAYPGEQRTWVLQLFPVRDQENQVVSINIVAKEVTQTKKVESELRASEERYRALIELAPDAILVHQAGPIIYANHVAVHLMGATSSESLIGMNLLDLVHPDDRAMVAERVRAASQGEITPLREVRYRRLDGQTVYVESTGATLPFRGQSAIVMIFRDITRRREMNEELRRNEALLRAICESSPDLIFVKDLECRIVMANPAMCAFLGTTENEILGKTENECGTHMSDHRTAAEDDRLIMETGHACSFEESIETDNGRRVFLSTKVPWRDYRGRVIGIITSSRDITDRKHDEDLLRQGRDELEQRVAERTAQLAQAHQRLRDEIADRLQLQDEIVRAGEDERQRIGQDLHDGLCQLLAAILMKTEALLNNAMRPSLTRTRRIQSVTALLKQAIEQARSLSRGLQPVDPGPDGLMLSLHTLAEATQNLHRINCTCQIEPPVSIPDHERAVHLFRIAQEAVNNAVKHGSPTLIKIELAQNLDEVVLTVTNDGVQFFTSSRSAGMGLKIMQFRAQRIGASLEVYAGPKAGTIVRCVLPATSLGTVASV
jgi:PAS domain S-box-containing protein